MRRRLCKYNRPNERLPRMRSASQKRQASGPHVLAALPREAVRRTLGRMMRVFRVIESRKLNAGRAYLDRANVLTFWDVGRIQLCFIPDQPDARIVAIHGLSLGLGRGALSGRGEVSNDKSNENRCRPGSFRCIIACQQAWILVDWPRCLSASDRLVRQPCSRRAQKEPKELNPKRAYPDS